MKSLISKELKLSLPGYCYFYLLFSCLVFCPGYPILCAAIFTCLGIYQGFLFMRESNDALYSVLLPVKKSDVVQAKYFMVVIYQMISFAVIVLFTLVRMFVVYDNEVYVQNALMNANPFFLGCVLIIFVFFNTIFLCGYFKTVYKIGKPFIIFLIVAFIFLMVCEMIHTIPGMGFVDEVSGDLMWAQCVFLIITAAFYVVCTVLSCKQAQKRFEKLDL